MSDTNRFQSYINPNFWLYIGSMIFLATGITVQPIAQSLLIYRLTGSTSMLGTLVLARALPIVLLGIFGGVIADRYPKKHIIQIGLLIFALLSLIEAVTLSTGYLSTGKEDSWRILMVIVTCQGIVTGLMIPASVAIIPEIVNKNGLMNTLATKSLGATIVGIFAPSLAGLIIDLIGFSIIFYVITVMYFISAFLVHFIPPNERPDTPIDKNALNSIKDGIKYLFSQKNILIVLVFSLFFAMVSDSFNYFIAVFTENILQVGASGLGILVLIIGYGSGLAALFLALLPNRKRGIMLLMTGIIMGITVVGFVFLESWYLAIPFVFIIGISQAGNKILFYTIALHHTEQQHLGRIVSFFTIIFGLTSVGTILAGWLADSIGVQWTVGGTAIILFVITLLFLAASPRIRNFE